MNLSKFDKTKSSFQAVILPSGEVIDVSDNFLSTLVELIAMKYDISCDMVVDLCPYSNLMRALAWMCNTLEAVCINETDLFAYMVSEAQVVAIQSLRDEGLYIGKIPYYMCN